MKNTLRLCTQTLLTLGWLTTSAQADFNGYFAIPCPGPGCSVSIPPGGSPVALGNWSLSSGGAGGVDFQRSPASPFADASSFTLMAYPGATASFEIPGDGMGSYMFSFTYNVGLPGPSTIYYSDANGYHALSGVGSAVAVVTPFAGVGFYAEEWGGYQYAVLQVQDWQGGTTPSPEYTYTTDNGMITITGYNGPGGAVTIPSTINDLPVTRIGDNAFQNNTSLTSVTIGDSVTSIGSGAFYHCSGLTSVTIGNSVTSIGYEAFSGCSGLTSVTILNSVTSIASSAFSQCSRLTAFAVETTNPAYSSLDGVLFNKSQTTLIQFPTGKAGNYTIPNSVTSLGDSAFSYCSGLTNVTIPNSVTNIGYSEFSNCSGLTSVIIPNSITSIGYGAFYSCSGLTSVTIPNSVTSLGDSAFSYCSGLTSVTIPNSVTNIGYSEFSNCSGLTSITIPNSVTSIGSQAFYSCSGLTSVTIGNSVTSIGNKAFDGCYGLTSFSVEAQNASYSSLDGVLFNKSQTALIQFPKGRNGSYTIPNSVTSIGSYAFYTCSWLANVTIGNSVTNLEVGAFSFCSGLTNVTIPNSVTCIGTTAFYACSGLTSFTIGNNVTNIGDGAFCFCRRLANVTIGNGVTSIGGDAFAQCPELRSMFFRGNAPAVGTRYALGYPTVCYYLPGTTGWGAYWNGRPAYLWNPAPQTANAKFGIRANRFGFNITGTTNIPIVVEASTNLTAATWVPLQTCTLTNGLIYFSDPAWTNFSTRHYRIRSP